MTNKSARKVVIINDIKSDMIEQAIFILKSERISDTTMMEKNSNILAEAHHIIDKYIMQIEKTRCDIEQKTLCKKKSLKRHLAFYLFWTALTAIFLGIMYYISNIAIY